jgi:protoporphyrinogen/coproporphyrinogen III oxidase
MNSVAIIGGGITGLTAALRLQRMGIPFELYEASNRVGGVIHSVRQNGYLAECGPNSILETSPVIRDLVKDLGLEGEQVYSNPSAANRYVVRKGRPVQMPGSALEFLTTQLFSPRAKLRLLREPLIKRASPAAEESIGAFVERRIGREFLDYAINPFVAGIYAGDPARLSLKHAFPKLHALEQKYGSLLLGQFLGARERRRRPEVSKQNAPKFSFIDGLQTLIDAAHARIHGHVRLSAAVKGLEQSERGWSVSLLQNGVARERQHGAVLLAAPAHKLASIELKAQASPALTELGAIRYAPVASLVLGFRREDVAHPLDGFGVLAPEKERLNILGVIFSSSLFPQRAPADHVTLTIYLGGMRAPDLVSRPLGTLIALAMRDLGTILGVRSQPTFVHHCVFQKAIPQYEIGFGEFKQHMDNLESELPGLFLAGHFRDGISLSDSIVAGHNVAERVEQFVVTRSLAVPSPQPDFQSESFYDKARSPVS